MFGLLRNLFAKGGVAKAAYSLKDRELWYDLGVIPSASGEIVNAQTAMRMSAVYRCVAIISGVIASMPVDFFKKEGDKRILQSKHPLSVLLKRKPNQIHNKTQFIEYIMNCLLLHGNAYIYKVISGTRILELQILNPEAVTVTQEKDLSLSYKYTKANGDYKEFNNNDTRFPLIHTRGITTNGYMGLSVIQAAREAIGQALASERTASQLVKNSMNPEMALVTEKTLSPQAKEQLKQTFFELRKNKGKTPVFEDGLTPKPLSMNNKDAQFIENRQFQIREIARFFGVPGFMLNDTEKSTSWGSGMEQQNTSFVQFTLMRWINNLEETFNRHLLSDEEFEEGYYFKISENGLLRGDTSSRQAFYKSMFETGAYSANEIRAYEDENPREDDGGNAYFCPMNYKRTDKPIPREEEKNAGQ